MTPETAAAVLTALKKRGVSSLHIGGGEPFVRFEALCALLSVMRDCGVLADYVETNACWCSGAPADREKLSRLRELGAPAVMFSLCPYHAAFVPLARVKNAVQAAQAVGIDYFVYQTQFSAEVAALGDETAVHPLSEYEARFPGGTSALPARFGVRLCGRAALTHAQLCAVPAKELLTRAKPCPVLSRTGHFHVDLYGCFVPSGCNGIAIPVADMDDVGARHPATSLLMREGMRALVEAARSLGFAPEAAYPGACALCQHARAYLALRAPDDWPDLRPLDFYLELYPQAAPEKA